MIESSKILEILESIDQDETYNNNAWWKKHCGADFGKEKLKELLDYIELEKKDIGLKDINGKSLYADSSIIEMYRGLDSFVGYYSYNKNKAHYEFIILDGCDNDSFGNIIGSSLKIIDTIQENKLRLIK